MNGILQELEELTKGLTTKERERLALISDQGLTLILDLVKRSRACLVEEAWWLRSESDSEPKKPEPK